MPASGRVAGRVRIEPRIPLPKTAPNKRLQPTASSVRSCLAVRRNSSNCIPDE